jgi:phosphoserine aminotransferase
LKHYDNLGGIGVLESSAQQRALAVYAAIDDSNFYYSAVKKAFRSRMSIPLTIEKNGKRYKDLEQKFVKQSAALGMIQLFGHPVAGGLRVTLYHGVSDHAVAALIKFMRNFQQENWIE